MAELSTLARPYAKAAFEYALDKNGLDQWSSQLATVAAVAADEGMNVVLSNPSLTAAQQAQTLSDVCGDAVSAEVRNFIGILASNKRLALLPEISA
ncbi:MAG: ATP synthase F1 subunit delta, partial [Halioglobus sp.]|nr:ATP synthase F1 subunit delta [Halioglobus sp.]